jgi:hypothetical protein
MATRLYLGFLAALALKLRLDPTRAHHAPASHRFKEGEKPRSNQHETGQRAPAEQGNPDSNAAQSPKESNQASPAANVSRKKLSHHPI